MKKTQKIKDDEISMYEFFTKQVNWDAMDQQQRKTIEVTLMMLLSCVENEKINTSKLAEITALVSKGEMKFAS